MDRNIEEKLEAESVKLDKYNDKTIIELMKTVTDRKGVLFLKKLLSKQSMHNYFSSNEQLEILRTEDPNDLLKILSGKSKWFDGNFLTILHKYLTDAGLEQAEEALLGDLCDQIYSLVTDFNRTKNTEKGGEVWIIDQELQKQLQGVEDETKLHHFCAGILNKSVSEFKTESSRQNDISDTQVPPRLQDNTAYSGEPCCHSLLVEAAH